VSADLPIRQGEIWLVALGAARRGEPGKNRPAVVVSNNSAQAGLDTDLISVVPLTTARVATALRPAIPAVSGLTESCVAVCDAVRALARPRFLERVGVMPGELMDRVMAARRLVEFYEPARQNPSASNG
jgi:mRNA interferase MazF